MINFFIFILKLEACPRFYKIKKNINGGCIKNKTYMNIFKFMYKLLN